MPNHHRFTDYDHEIEKNVEQLLSQMTLTEKVMQMVQLCPNRMAQDDLEKQN